VLGHQIYESLARNGELSQLRQGPVGFSTLH
jgi:hypothetical protein